MEFTPANAMADQALPLHDHLRPALRKRSNFYVLVAIACLLLVVAGFFMSYILPVTTGTFAGRSILHLHGGLYLCWLLLFIAQPLLVRLGYTKIHRKIGVAGFVLAALMLVIGTAVAIEGVRLNSPTMSVVGLQAKSFLLIPLTDMLLFASFIGLSLANLKRPEWHKRLMVLATAALLPAATGRLLFALQLPESILLFTVSQEVILIAAIANDLFTRRKIHPAYLWGGALMLIVHLTRFPLAGTSWWSSVAEWIVG